MSIMLRTAIYLMLLSLPLAALPSAAAEEQEKPARPQADVTNKKYYLSDDFNFQFRAPKGYAIRAGENFYLTIGSVSDELAGVIHIEQLKPGTSLEEFYTSWKAQDATFENWGYTEIPCRFKEKYIARQVRLEHMGDEGKNLRVESMFFIKNNIGYMIGAFGQGAMTSQTPDFLQDLQDHFDFLDDFLKKPRKSTKSNSFQD